MELAIRSLEGRRRGTGTPELDNLADRLGAFDAHQLLVQAAVEVAQPVRIQPELMQDRGMEVLDVETVLDGVVAQLVGLADAGPALDPAAGHPHREAVGVMVATSPLGELRGRLAAELAAPDNQRLIE